MPTTSIHRDALLTVVFRGNRVVASDAYAMEDAKRAAAGLPPANRGPRGERPHQEATDDQAYERFKKRYGATMFAVWHVADQQNQAVESAWIHFDRS